MIVYGSSLSPYVRKVLVIAAEKGIEVDNQVFGPGLAPTPEFLEASPFGRIPALRDGDFSLADSSAIAHYLEATHPEPPLIPREAKALGKAIWFDELADTLVFDAIVEVFFNRVVGPLIGGGFDIEVARRAEAEKVPPVLAYLERTVPEAGWLVGDGFTLADIAVASPFVNLELAGRPVRESSHPRLHAYLRRVHARPSFAAVLESNRAFVGRFKDRLHVGD